MDAKWYANWIRLLPASTAEEKIRNLEAADMLEKLEAENSELRLQIPRWISAEEPPKTDEWVAVWYRDKDGDCFFTAGRYFKHTNGQMYWRTDVDDNAHAYPPAEITHWMPLPKPKEEVR